MAWSPLHRHCVIYPVHLSSTSLPFALVRLVRRSRPYLSISVIKILGVGERSVERANPIRKGPKVCPDKQINAISTGRVCWPGVWKQSPFPGRVAGLPVRAEQGAKSGKQERNLISDLRVCIAVYQSEPSQPELNPPPFSTPSVWPWATRTRSVLRPIQCL